MDRSHRAYLIRLAKSAVFLALGAAAHVWLLPSTRPTNDELVAIADPAAFVPQPSTPDGRSVSAQLESASDGTGGVPRSPLAPPAAPVGTSGRVTIAIETVAAQSIFERRNEQRTSDRQIAANDTPATDERIVGTMGTSESIETGGTSGTSASLGTVGSFPPTEPAVAWIPTAELQLASEALSPARRSLQHDEVALVKAAVTPDAPHIAVNARQLGDDEQMVRSVLQQYRTAYEQLDAAAAKSIWPTVDERALGHAFQQLAAQRLTFRSCGISISGTGANARCRGEAEYLPKIGAKRAFTTSGEWVFDLTREQTSWRIINASVQ